MYVDDRLGRRSRARSGLDQLDVAEDLGVVEASIPRRVGAEVVGPAEVQAPIFASIPIVVLAAPTVVDQAFVFPLFTN